MGETAEPVPAAAECVPEDTVQSDALGSRTRDVVMEVLHSIASVVYFIPQVVQALLRADGYSYCMAAIRMVGKTLPVLTPENVSLIAVKVVSARTVVPMAAEEPAGRATSERYARTESAVIPTAKVDSVVPMDAGDRVGSVCRETSAMAGSANSRGGANRHTLPGAQDVPARSACVSGSLNAALSVAGSRTAPASAGRAVVAVGRVYRIASGRSAGPTAADRVAENVRQEIPA